MSNSCEYFLYFKEYNDIFLKQVVPYLADNIFDLLKSWPFVVLICALTFKEDIKHLLSRLKTLPLGTEFNPETEAEIEQKEDKENFDKAFAEQKKEDSTKNVLADKPVEKK